MHIIRVSGKKRIRSITVTLLAALALLMMMAPANVLAAADPIEVVTNGSFETGNFSGWHTQIVDGSPLLPWYVVTQGSYDNWYGMAGVSPQAGARAATNGFDGGVYYQKTLKYIMWQDVTLPDGQATFSWMERIQWRYAGYGGFANLPRTYDVQIRDAATDSVIDTLYSFSTGTQAENPTGDTGWQSHSVDVSGYAGTTIRLYFLETIPESSTGPARIDFDAISLLVIPNQAPDVSQAYASADCLWPANHKMVDVNILGVTDPDDDPVTITITGITSDEPTASDEGSGGAKHSPDADGIETDTASVRAERSGNGDGRVYVISFIADDGRGGISEGSVTVGVPHDQSDEECTAIDSGQNYDATGVN